MSSSHRNAPSLPLLSLLAALAPPAAAQRTLLALEGSAPQEAYGQSVSGAGDVDGDGVDDLIVGVPSASTVGSWNGRVEVRAGQTGNLLWAFEGLAGGDKLGSAVAGAGDVNGDGHADVLAGALLADRAGMNAGLARVWSGLDGTLLHDLDGVAPGDYFGASVAGVGDLDHDGHDDFAVGAPGSDANGADCGRVTVFSGQSGAALFVVDGAAAGDLLGLALAGLGDVNADGTADLATGAPGADPNGAESGRVLVLSGASAAVLHAIDGAAAGDGLGSSLAGAGDVDGDGTPDLVAGAPASDAAGADAGWLIVWSLQGPPSVLFQAFGAAPGDRLGISVAGGTDVDGDGFDDFAAGAASDDANGPNSGSVTVFRGPAGVALLTYYREGEDAQLGFALAAAGDWNGDGRGDLAIGAPTFDAPAGNGAGLALVLAGQGPVGSNYCAANANSTGAPAQMRGLGSVAVVDNDLSLLALDLPPAQFGYFLASLKSGFFPFVGGSQGNLCLGGTIGRFTQQARKSGPAGTFGIDVDLTALPPPLQSAVLPGETWHFTAWYRRTSRTVWRSSSCERAVRA